eukprot:6313268-Amphidinium_carterae.1
MTALSTLSATLLMSTESNWTQQATALRATLRQRVNLQSCTTEKHSITWPKMAQVRKYGK